MNVAVRSHATAKQASEHFDVLIVGAGISGIGSAYHMTKQLPGASFVILETQATFGGTWTTHRYPGIRSDSDLHTFGYSFKPWVGPPIASAEEILTYMNEVIDDNDIAKHIRYRHKINSASWSERAKSLDHRSGDDRHRRSENLHREFPLDVPGLLPPFRRLHARMEGHGAFQGPHRPSADLAG
jgi:cation diffusion facilitator CzcD-associated flavoprotein CzcO